MSRTGGSNNLSLYQVYLLKSEHVYVRRPVRHHVIAITIRRVGRSSSAHSTTGVERCRGVDREYRSGANVQNREIGKIKERRRRHDTKRDTVKAPESCPGKENGCRPGSCHHTLMDRERKTTFSPYDASSHTTSRKYCPLLEPGQYVRVQISLGQRTIQHVRIGPDTHPI